MAKQINIQDSCDPDYFVQMESDQQGNRGYVRLRIISSEQTSDPVDMDKKALGEFIEELQRMRDNL
jgi:hypothetical protein